MAASVGLSDPSLAYNLSSLADWSTQMPFLDIMKMSRPFYAYQDAGGVMNHAALRAGGYLDEDGWPTALPEGTGSIGTLWDWSGGVGDPRIADSREGVYVMSWKGEGSLNISGSLRILSQSDTEIVFENTTGGFMELKLLETDPNGTGNYLRDIEIVRQDMLPLYDAGQIFNPDWLEIVGDARGLRFMDWMRTNNSEVSAWEDRPQPSDASYSLGVPLEAMVELANQTGSDPWFTLPHLATPDHIRAFATYVRKHLDPKLVATVELSNEAWNGSFRQYGDLGAMAQAEWGVWDANSYYSYKATEMAQIWKEVFGDQAEDRLVTTLGLQTVNTYSARTILEAPSWQTADPETYIRPADVFDAMTITTYFGGATVANTELRAAYMAAINDPDVNSNAWLAAKLRDPAYAFSLPEIRGYLEDMRALADQEGLDLIAYEGGQHVHHSFTLDAGALAFGEALQDFVRSPEMADLYEDMWDIWADLGDGPFMQLGDVGQSTQFGSWSLRDGLDDTNPRTERVEALNASTPAWWEDRGGDHFRQGLNLIGDADGNVLDGTSQEDFMAGLAGDDLLTGLGQDDHLSGGAGQDTLLGGGGSDEAKGHVGADKLVGNQGRDRLLGNAGADTLQGGGGSDSLLGGNGRDEISGGGGNDRITGGSGADRLTGGAGADRFILRPGDGADVITDLTLGDSLAFDLAALGYADAASLMAAAAQQDGADVILTLGGLDSLRLENTNFASVEAAIL